MERRDADSIRGENGEPGAHLNDPQLFLGRDLSWLEFNARVLAQAADENEPLLDRCKFLAIFESNFDEFFMKRVALLKHRESAGLEALSHDGRTVRQQLDAIRPRIVELQVEQGRCFEQQLLPALADEGIRILSYEALDGPSQDRVDAWFRENVFPILTPLAVDPGHRFPFISNLSVSLAVLMSQGPHAERMFARLKIPESIPRLISVPQEGQIGRVVDPKGVRLVRIDDIVRYNLGDVFPGLEILDVLPFRVTRSTGLDFDDDDIEDMLEHVESSLRLRRFADPVRIETGIDPSPNLLDVLLEELELERDDVYSRGGLLSCSDLYELARLDRPDLSRAKWVPVVPKRLQDEEADIFSVIRERDLFVHHPYESFTASVERFIESAADDPNVLAIKLTLYRTSRDSPFVESLIRAAEEGKSVACMVELRARFDEDKNMRFARQLEKHGVHVAYGVLGLKTHSKCSLVVRREGDGLRTYAHVGTGNYHPGTAQLYTDCGLLTCDPEITQDVVNMFNYLTGRSLHKQYGSLLVAPVNMRRKFERLIDREIEIARNGGKGRIILKMNSLEDVGMITKLYKASIAGVEITLMVRGQCSLRPGVPGVSENITVLSVIGRFLEHSRLFHFGNAQDNPIDGDWFIGSADWMSRNLNKRVEVVVPVKDRKAREQLWQLTEASMRDRKRAWLLGSYGQYQRLIPKGKTTADSPESLGVFEYLCRRAMQEHSADPDPDGSDGGE
jgi:polyphosphate kinase